MLRVAVVGSGPAGVYAAAALSGDEHQARVDVFDRLPCPYGLVRYGVAPDHPKIKSITATLRKVFEQSDVAFLGNVEVGTDITLGELHRHYDAVVLAFGAAVDRHLDVPGESLPGSFSSTEFVAWYSGHPDHEIDRFSLEATSVAVIGQGNVAVDVTRILAKTADDLRGTDLPDHVLDVLEQSRVTDIHMVGRRGPAQAKFTTKELRELGEIADADVLVDPDDLQLDDVSRARLDEHAQARRNYDVLTAWAEREPEGRSRRIHLRFWRRPVEVVGDQRVSGVRFERTTLDEAGRAVGTGTSETVDAQMVLRSVGYRGLPLQGVPFDEDEGVIPNDAGRVVQDGVTVPGLYVAGWIKRGPTGVIGTNKSDANETVTSLLADAGSLPRASERDPQAVHALLAGRGVQVVPWQGWCAIDLAEAERGRVQGRERVKIVDRSELLAAAARSVPRPSEAFRKP